MFVLQFVIPLLSFWRFHLLLYLLFSLYLSIHFSLSLTSFLYLSPSLQVGGGIQGMSWQMQRVELLTSVIPPPPDTPTLEFFTNIVPLKAYTGVLSYPLSLSPSSLSTWNAHSFSTLFFDRTIRPGESIQASLRVYLPLQPKSISSMPTAVGVQLFPFCTTDDQTNPEYPTPPAIQHFEAFPLGLHTYSAALLLPRKLLANGELYSYCSPLKSSPDSHNDDDFFLTPPPPDAPPNTCYTDVTVIIHCSPINDLLNRYVQINNGSSLAESKRQELLKSYILLDKTTLKRTHLLSISFKVNDTKLDQEYFSDVFHARIGV